MVESRWRERLSWLADAGPDGRRLAVAAASGAAAVAVGFLVTSGSPRWIVFVVAQTLFFLVPDTVIRVGIERLGDLSQPLLVAGSGLLAVGVYALIALAGMRLGRASERTRAESVFAVGVGQTLVGFLLTVAPVPAAVAGAAGAVVVGLSGLGGSRSDHVSRRRLLRAGGAAAAALGAGGTLAALRLRGASAEPTGEVDDPLVRELLSAADDRSLSVAGLEGLVSDGFYEVDINPANPRVSREQWSLAVEGAVEQSVELAFDELRELPVEHRFVSLRCVGDTLDGRKLDTALWTGVPVSAVVEAAGVDSEACCVMLRAADDYYMEFPVAALDDALLAFRMNGRPLPRAHGAPVRALIPGHWGEINVKWLTEMEFLTEPADGYWEKRGWNGTGPVNTVAKLYEVDTDGDSVVVAGHAYAGTRGISGVEVSVDGGETWAEATVSEPLPDRVPADADPDDPVVREGAATDAWRMWRYEYTKRDPHEVVVRAVEADGTVQPREPSEPFPDGASGWVSRKIDP